MPLKPRNKLASFLFALILAITFGGAFAYAADSYSIANGANQNITEHTVCQKVTNATGNSIMVPTKATGEWSSFRTSPPAGVTLAGCCPAGGVMLNGVCWYMGTNGQSCTTVCTSRGGYNAVTLSYAGSGGTNAQCKTVLDALAVTGTTVSTNGSCSVGAVGCTFGVGSRVWCSGPATTAAASHASYARACACLTGSNPTSVTYVTMSTAVDTTSITIPATAQAGDLAVLVDATISLTSSGAPPTTVVPAGFTQITNTSGQGSGGAYNRTIVSAKILGSGDPGAVLTTMAGGATTGYQRKAIAIFRPNAPASSFTAGSVGQQMTTSAPTNQTVTSSAGAVPLVVFSAYRAGAAITTRGFSPAEDAELAAGGTAFYLKYKLYNSAPANVTASMNDTGNENTLHSMYFTLQ